MPVQHIKASFEEEIRSTAAALLAAYPSLLDSSWFTWQAFLRVTELMYAYALQVVTRSLHFTRCPFVKHQDVTYEGTYMYACWRRTGSGIAPSQITLRSTSVRETLPAPDWQFECWTIIVCARASYSLAKVNLTIGM